NGEAESRLPPAKKQPASPPQEASAINAPAQASEKSMPAPPPIPKPPVFSQQLSSGNRPTVTPKEVSGTANLPQEDDLEIPKPPAEIVQPSPSQGEYEMAKGDLRVKLSQEDKEEAARQEAESMLEQYARQNIVWLYEIYKMGGLSREEFLQKVKEKMADGKKEAPEPAAQNNALSNLGREIDKKYNK
ncbi:MAG: hypothetical protein NT051_01165, partial [Candidatus Micrarchaeota archaeon]|nr:hypothetical protein [Candidatus Micrarchaeota archaeon]